MIATMSRALQYHQRFPPGPSAISTRTTPTPTSPLDFTDRIPFSELQLSSKTLGSGSYGTVYKGRWRGRDVAVKEFKTREEIDSFSVEVKQLSCVQHSHIVHLHGASISCDTAYLVMEYAEGGSLNHLLHERMEQAYDLRHACSWAKQIAKGIAYLHEIRPKPIMHRDLKPANLLLFEHGKLLKICDFGTACTVKTQMTNNTGSASYMAPEVFATSSYLESGDVFSWSIIFWEILARRHPYSQDYTSPYQILWLVKTEGIRPKELESCPKIIWKLITRSWSTDPNKRPSMREIANKMEFIYSLTARPSSPSALPPSLHQQPHHHHNQYHVYNGDNIKQNRSSYRSKQLFESTSHHRQHNYKQVPSFVDLTEAFDSDQSSSETAKKDKYARALLYRLQLLHRRVGELEDSPRAESKSSLHDSEQILEEFEELKRKIGLRKEELKRKIVLRKELQQQQHEYQQHE